MLYYLSTHLFSIHQGVQWYLWYQWYYMYIDTLWSIQWCNDGYSKDKIHNKLANIFSAFPVESCCARLTTLGECCYIPGPINMDHTHFRGSEIEPFYAEAYLFRSVVWFSARWNWLKMPRYRQAVNRISMIFLNMSTYHKHHSQNVKSHNQISFGMFIKWMEWVNSCWLGCVVTH